MLGKDQQAQVFIFFKHFEREGQSIGGETFKMEKSIAQFLKVVLPVLNAGCIDVIEKGDHSIFVGVVVNTVVNKQPETRCDEATLWMLGLGEKVFLRGLIFATL